MAKNNTLYVESTEMSNVIIKTDAQGYSAITHRNEFKYNKLINKRHAASSLRKNIVIIDNKDVTETIIEADDCGNNTLKSFDEYVTEEMDTNAGNIFKDLLMKTRKKKEVQSSLIDVYLTEKRVSLQEKLKKATEFYKAGLFAKANELYENALDTIKYDSYPDEFMLNDCDILAIKFGLVLSKVGVNDYASLHTAEEILTSLIDKHGTEFPSLFYYLAKVLYNLNNYKKAQIILEDGLKILDRLDYLTVINWPGTKDNMVEKSTKTFLEQNMIALLNKCKIFHMHDLKCYFHPCDENNDIFYSSPLFTGYVALKCTNKCNFTYHRSCWKRKMKQDGVKKPNTIVNQLCTTDDCHGVLYQIIIFDETLRVLSSTTGTANKDQSKGVKNGCKTTLSKVDKKFKPDENKKIGEDEIKTKQSEKDGNIAVTSVADKQDLSSTKDAESEKLKLKSDETAQQNKFTLNSNAKEYVPSNFKLHNINISNNMIQIDEDGTEGNKLLNSKLNSNAKEYVPPLRVIKMLGENTVTNYCEQSTQTAQNINQDELDMLKCDIRILQMELFKSEENYNNLLVEMSSKEALKPEKNDISTETDPTICASCVQLNSNLTNRDEAYKNVISLNEQLEHKVKELKEELNKLKAAQILDRDIVVVNEQKFIESNKVLMHKIQELTAEKEKLKKEFQTCSVRTNREIPYIKTVLLEQISFVRNFYLSYIAMFENKCKHMIWELEDIKALTNANTLPTSTEIEENLIMWRQALEDAVKNHSFVLLFYDKLFKKFTTHPEEALIPTPIPSLIPEPPSVILRHFKSFFVINKRLENDLHRHMTNYYKMISMPYPGAYPYNMSQSPIPLPSESQSHCDRRASVSSVETEVRVIHPPPGLGNEVVRFNQEEVSEEISGEQSSEAANFSYDSTQENFSEVIENITTIISTTSTETTNLNKTAISSEPLNEAASLPTTKQEKEKKAVVVGPDGLLFKLQQKYPITPPKILQEAVQILRTSRGGLTGLDSKTMMTELRHIIAELMKIERQKSGYQKVSMKQKSPWAPINNSVQWQNNDPKGNCAICFEQMDRKNSTQLRCQHVFHTSCIKTWLQTDGICPICRSYTTLDDEFPPLK